MTRLPPLPGSGYRYVAWNLFLRRGAGQGGPLTLAASRWVDQAKATVPRVAESK